MVEDWVNYICPVKGAKEALIANDPQIADNPLIFPSDADLANAACLQAADAAGGSRVQQAVPGSDRRVT